MPMLYVVAKGGVWAKMAVVESVWPPS